MRLIECLIATRVCYATGLRRMSSLAGTAYATVGFSSKARAEPEKRRPSVDVLLATLSSLSMKEGKQPVRSVEKRSATRDPKPTAEVSKVTVEAQTKVRRPSEYACLYLKYLPLMSCSSRRVIQDNENLTFPMRLGSLNEKYTN